MCALASAFLYALASVLQQRAAAAAPSSRALRIGLLARLACKPLWVLGILADVGGYAAQFTALDHGSLILVQPLLVCGLLFALPLGASLAGARLALADWVAAAAVCAGLATFLTVAGSAHGHHHPPHGAWAIVVTSAAGLTAALLLAARGRPAHQRAALWSAAAGVLYGMAAGFTKAAGLLLRHGLLHLLASWQVWALVVTGILGMVLAQSAFQAGALEGSLPAMAVVDPVVSIVIGIAVFGERLPTQAGALALEVIGLALMAVGVLALARAKAVQAVHHA